MSALVIGEFGRKWNRSDSPGSSFITLYDSYYNETPDLSLAGSDLTTPTTIRALLRR